MCMNVGVEEKKPFAGLLSHFLRYVHGLDLYIHTTSLNTQKAVPSMVPEPHRLQLSGSVASFFWVGCAVSFVFKAK